MNKRIDVVENHFEVKGDSSMTLLLVLKNKNTEVTYDLKNGDYRIFIFDMNKEDSSYIEKGTVKDAHVRITYMSLAGQNTTMTSSLSVLEGGELEYETITLGTGKKRFDLYFTDEERNTVTSVRNSAVTLKEGDLVLNCTGKIVKGAKHSTMHQKNICLTLEAPKQAKILPILLIDENDVQASHSLSSGTIDRDVMFYMNSRGLDDRSALVLVLKSLLIPEEAFFEVFEDGLEIRKMAEAMVEASCSI